MSFKGKPIHELAESDLQQLIADRVRESQALEFKKEPYGRNDNQVKEMLRDISSMANAFGGDLLIGIEENGEGLPVVLTGVDNAEEEAQRIVNSCLSNIDERIPGLVAWPVPLASGRHVIVVHVPRGLRAPHMVTFKGINQFWMRHDRQKSRMSIHEIRDACLKVEGLMEKLERFLERQKKAIRMAPYYLVSITPIFVDSEVVDILDTQLRELLKKPPGQRPSGWTVFFHQTVPRPTLHGLALGYPKSKILELHRNGHLELLVRIDDMFCPNSIAIGGQDHPVLDVIQVCEYAVSLLRLGKAVYSHLGITDPLVVSLSFYHIRRHVLLKEAEVVGRSGQIPCPFDYYPEPWDKEEPLEIPPRQTPSLEEPDKVAKECLDRVWQAFGYEHAPLFDAKGNFCP